MGSPLAVFLALRGIRPGTSCQQDHIMPTTICRRLFNVFHPTDPVVSLLSFLRPRRALALVWGYDIKPHFLRRIAAFSAVFCQHRPGVFFQPSQDRFSRKCSAVKLFMFCSGLQTGASHPQALQQYRTHSNTLVRAYFLFILRCAVTPCRHTACVRCIHAEYLGCFLYQV